MRAHLRAGVAIYNEGRFHAAHDAWEDHWLDLDSGTDDERLLHGLIQFTAVVHHAHDENWSGAAGLADSAGEDLAGLPSPYRGVDLDAIRPFLDRMADEPESFDPGDEPQLTHDGVALPYEDLGIDATAIAARVLAEEDDYDVAAVERASEWAREEIEAGESGEFTGLVFSFVRDPDHRPIIAQRLIEHVERRENREADVEGLFE